MKKIGIIGTRKRNTHDDFIDIKDKFFKLYEDGDQIVSGGCPKGADNFAEEIARIEGVSITIHYPNWSRYETREDNQPNPAAFIRNTTIAQYSDIIIACVNNPSDTLGEVLKRKVGGTEDTLRKFRVAEGQRSIWGTQLSKLTKKIHLV